MAFERICKKKALFFKLQFKQLTMSIISKWKKINQFFKWAKTVIILKLELYISCLQRNVFAQLQITGI